MIPIRWCLMITINNSLFEEDWMTALFNFSTGHTWDGQGATTTQGE